MDQVGIKFGVLNANLQIVGQLGKQNTLLRRAPQV